MYYDHELKIMNYTIFKIGDKVKMDLDAIIKNIGHHPPWYSDEVFKVIEINCGSSTSKDDNGHCIRLNKKLIDMPFDTIYRGYLKLDDTSLIRMNKLKKLNNV